jgi:hypothetical protein
MEEAMEVIGIHVIAHFSHLQLAAPAICAALTNITALFRQPTLRCSSQ